MANIKKRKDSYQITVCVGMEDGKQCRKYKTWTPPAGMSEKKAEKEVQKIAMEFEQEVQGGDIQDDSGRGKRMRDFCTDYLELYKNHLSPNSYSQYRRVIEQYILPSLGHLLLKNLRPLHLQKFVNMLINHGAEVTEKCKALSPASVRRYYVVLQSILSQAYKYEMLTFNPNHAMIDLPKQEEKELEIFTPEQAQEVVQCLKEEPLKYQLLIHIAIMTGARRGEIVGLQWDCVDWKSSEIIIKQSAYKVKGEEGALKSTKTNKIRRVSVAPETIALLKKHRTDQLAERFRLGDRWRDENFIFTQWDGKAMSIYTPSSWFSEFLERHNLPHRKFHALRHTSATLLLSNGVDIKTVMDRLGHTQLSTTNRYVHKVKSADENAADTITNLICGKPAKSKLYKVLNKAK